MFPIFAFCAFASLSNFYCCLVFLWCWLLYIFHLVLIILTSLVSKRNWTPGYFILFIMQIHIVKPSNSLHICSVRSKTVPEERIFNNLPLSLAAGTKDLARRPPLPHTITDKSVAAQKRSSPPGPGLSQIWSARSSKITLVTSSTRVIREIMRNLFLISSVAHPLPQRELLKWAAPQIAQKLDGQEMDGRVYSHSFWSYCQSLAYTKFLQTLFCSTTQMQLH